MQPLPPPPPPQKKRQGKKVLQMWFRQLISKSIMLICIFNGVYFPAF